MLLIQFNVSGSYRWKENRNIQTSYAAVSAPNEADVEMKSSPHPTEILLCVLPPVQQHIFYLEGKKKLK